MLPLTKAQWQEQKDLWSRGAVSCPFPWVDQPGIAVQGSANWLLERLCSPRAKDGWCFKGTKTYLRAIGVPVEIADEPINWGDLSASVEQREGLWIVTLEEASAGQCPSLVGYVQQWLEKWGWPVLVQTEW